MDPTIAQQSAGNPNPGIKVLPCESRTFAVFPGFQPVSGWEWRRYREGLPNPSFSIDTGDHRAYAFRREGGIRPQPGDRTAAKLRRSALQSSLTYPLPVPLLPLREGKDWE
jgi:hypothetical protein